MSEDKQLVIQRLYLKDTSFEAPNTPEVFRSEWEPDTNVQINTNAEAVSDDGIFEVELTVTVTTKLKDTVAYIAEVQQAGLFTITGLGEEELRHALITYCPNLLFPFVRETVTDLIAKGSFPQFLLQPVNFEAMYEQHQQDMENAQEEAADAPKH